MSSGDYSGADTAGYFAGYYNNMILFGLNVSNVYSTGAVTPSEALDMDTKVDDGLPGYGSVRTYNGATMGFGGSSFSGNNCVTSSYAASGTYRVSYTNVSCPLLFLSTYQAPQQ